MASRVNAQRHMQVGASYPGPDQSDNMMEDQMPNPTAMSLPGVDGQQLKARLYSYAPKQAPINTRALGFKKPTNAQLKRAAIPSAPKLEPLVCHIKLQVYYYYCS